MTEARPIQAHEAEQFLTLLCDAFDLDISRARTVFFQEPSFDLNRKWALFDSGRLCTILTTSSLSFQSFKGIGIAGVATRPDQRGKGYGQALIEAAASSAESAGEGPALLFAKEPRLYHKCGFDVIDQVLEGEIRGSGDPDPDLTLLYDQVRERYTVWSAERPERLHRDDVRWKVWEWGLRSCEPIESGYVCYEGTSVREAVLPKGLDHWPVPPQTQWVGLNSMTDEMEVPLISRRETGLFLMGRNFPVQPAMFMTDQF